MKKTLQLFPIVDLKPFIGEGSLVALNVGPDAQLYAVIAHKTLDYRTNDPDKASFVITKPDEQQAYRVVAFCGGELTLDVHIAHERFNIHEVQPLPGGEFLLVCCRSHYKGPNDFDKNGRVYSSDGILLREILLGDGIQNVQATTGGLIWTSFFDEGILGNSGWNDPIGASGLVAWDSLGNNVYEFTPMDGLDSVWDCYALNVESDSSTWLYYYTDFPLVHLHNRRIESHWKMPISGSHAFAVSRGSVLFCGGYDDCNDYDRDDYHLFELGPSGHVQMTASICIIDEDGDQLSADRIIGRSNALHIERDGCVYCLNVKAAVNA